MAYKCAAEFVDLSIPCTASKAYESSDRCALIGYLRKRVARQVSSALMQWVATFQTVLAHISLDTDSCRFDALAHSAVERFSETLQSRSCTEFYDGG